mmetsp:Transcript_13544/g.40958  ORF Transcript_13544/g.40958 Transcript_13544/m.40958 type:complete len:155 (+) Transcript_13544:509-973(+)
MGTVGAFLGVPCNQCVHLTFGISHRRAREIRTRVHGAPKAAEGAERPPHSNLGRSPPNRTPEYIVGLMHATLASVARQSPEHSSLVAHREIMGIEDIIDEFKKDHHDAAGPLPGGGDVVPDSWEERNLARAEHAGRRRLSNEPLSTGPGWRWGH